MESIVFATLELIAELTAWDGVQREYRAGNVVVQEMDMAELRQEVSTRAAAWVREGVAEVVRWDGTRIDDRMTLLLPDSQRARIQQAVRLAWNASLRRVQLNLPEWSVAHP